MIRVGVADELGRHALLTEGHVHLLGFLDRNPDVGFAMDEQGRGGNALRVDDR